MQTNLSSIRSASAAPSLHLAEDQVLRGQETTLPGW
jgi:hypothetical protein